MCHIVGAVLLVASMGMCYVFALFSADACPFIYTSDSGKSPAVWFIIFGTLITVAACFVQWMLAPPARPRTSSSDDEEDRSTKIALTAREP